MAGFEVITEGVFDLLDHLFLLLFCARFSRGTKRASGACSQAPRAAFLRGSQETSQFVLFLGGTTNPKGVRQRTDKAEARRAASAQASFPPRRAREKSVPEKVREAMAWVATILSGRAGPLPFWRWVATVDLPTADFSWGLGGTL